MEWSEYIIKMPSRLVPGHCAECSLIFIFLEEERILFHLQTRKSSSVLRHEHDARIPFLHRAYAHGTLKPKQDRGSKGAAPGSTQLGGTNTPLDSGGLSPTADWIYLASRLRFRAGPARIGARDRLGPWQWELTARTPSSSSATSWSKVRAFLLEPCFAPLLGLSWRFLRRFCLSDLSFLVPDLRSGGAAEEIVSGMDLGCLMAISQGKHGSWFCFW